MALAACSPSPPPLFAPPAAAPASSPSSWSCDSPLSSLDWRARRGLSVAWTRTVASTASAGSRPPAALRGSVRAWLWPSHRSPVYRSRRTVTSAWTSSRSVLDGLRTFAISRCHARCSLEFGACSNAPLRRAPTGRVSNGCRWMRKLPSAATCLRYVCTRQAVGCECVW